VCKKRRGAAYRLKNKEKLKTSSAKHYIANAEKINAKSKAYYAENTEKLKAGMKAWHKANPEKAKARRTAWKAANPEKVKENNAKRYAANPARHNAVCAAWQAANPEKVKENNVKWRAANPEAVRIYVQNYQARKRDNGGRLSNGLADKLFKLQRGKCACGCKQPLGDDYHLDHIIPLLLGGPNTDSNIQLLRAKCNLQKSAKHPVDFMQQRGFLL